ncbi:hypothetical protein C0Q70_08404 [Pomacea canaliculata]|uniref:Uncharacterized protein n=1 Tax=Pomacea canaliculata TaxID=400727 RepID=A0A2T7PHS5_POMCA|nr:hypothetical protein C0Q70_08404 [Pomacea canaliculata]
MIAKVVIRRHPRRLHTDRGYLLPEAEQEAGLLAVGKSGLQAHSAIVYTQTNTREGKIVLTLIGASKQQNQQEAEDQHTSERWIRCFCHLHLLTECLTEAEVNSAWNVGQDRTGLSLQAALMSALSVTTAEVE